MRLGDLDLAEKNIEENLNIRPCDRFAAMDEVRDTPTMNPEDLPLVKELRGQLVKAEAERDAAVKDLNKLNPCVACKYNCYSLEALTKRCNGVCYEWEWRGVEDENMPNVQCEPGRSS